MSLYSGAQMIEILSLNPYYNGKYSMSWLVQRQPRSADRS